MKILLLASYITILEGKELTKNVTGYGYMVRDIADYVSRTGVEIDVITTSAITRGRKFNNFTISKRTWADLLLHVKPAYFGNTIQLIKTYQPSLRRIVKMLFYNFAVGYVEHILKYGNYDLVNIHGVGFGTIPFINCCERLGIRYVVTLHGLNSFSDFIQMESGEKQFEKDFLKLVYNCGIPLTVISTGILNVIKDYLNVDGDIEHFYVVTNGTDVIEKKWNKLDIRQKYGITRDKRIMLCVGNLGRRKNQLQIVRAYGLLSEEMKKRLCILFLGKDASDGEIEAAICDSGFGKSLILCGNINRNEIAAFYGQSDYTILASISEGFGLSIIEGFVYGLPNLTFADLDAIEDLFDEKAMLTVANRSDESLAAGISEMLSRDWDKDYIKQYAKSFSLERMGQEYIEVFQEVISKKMKRA